MRCRSPSLRPTVFPPPSPPPVRRPTLFEASQVLHSRPTPHLFRDGFVSSTSRRGPGHSVQPGEMRSPKFRRLPSIRNGVSDRGRAVAPRVTVHNMLPSTVTNVSASATLKISRLYSPLHMIAVYASQPSSPPTTQHSLQGGALLPYPRRTFPGWNAPASLGAL